MAQDIFSSTRELIPTGVVIRTGNLTLIIMTLAVLSEGISLVAGLRSRSWESEAGLNAMALV